MVTRDAAPGWASLLGLGATTALIIVVGTLLGWLADGAANTLPIFTLVGLVLGVALAGRYMYLEVRKHFFND